MVRQELAMESCLDAADDIRARQYTESISITHPSSLKGLQRYFVSTYDFSSPRRYKTVVYLNPRLAPVRYWRSVNFGISQERRHKSGVDCDFRPLPDFYSETAWIFPKQARETFSSVIETENLVDTMWYKAGVSLGNGGTASSHVSEGASQLYSRGSLGGQSDSSMSDCELSDTEEHLHKLSLLTNNNYKFEKPQSIQEKMDGSVHSMD